MKQVSGVRWQAWAFVIGLALALDASAQGGRLGSQGQIVISSDLSGSIGYSSYEDSPDVFFISLRPAADYFLKENISLGGNVTLATGLQDGDDTLELGLGLRLGYHSWLSQKVSIWPRIGLGIGHEDYGAFDNTYFQIDLYSPFLFHPVSNFFIGGGPQLVTKLGDATEVTLAVTTTLGGYF